VAWAFAEWVNEESYRFAATGKAEYPMVSAEGGKEPLRAEYSAYTMGSDHDVYQDSAFGIPAIYLNDWPDRFIHTNLDSAANIDATKLKRAGFIGAASGYFLAQFATHDQFLRMLILANDRGKFLRYGFYNGRRWSLSTDEQEVIMDIYGQAEHSISNSARSWSPEKSSDWSVMSDDCPQCPHPTHPKGDAYGGADKFNRKYVTKGPMAVFGYDYFESEWAKRGHATKPKLLEYQGLWGGGEEYAYEVLNFADGKRNAQEIRDAVSAEYGPVPLELVVEYLKALEEIGVVEETK